MRDFRGKVAVITGASSGIGFGIAERCAQEGMNVVLAGITHGNLVEAEKRLQPTGATTLCVQTDVSKLADIQALAGLLPSHASAPYQVTKHAVVALTENLHYSLVQRQAKVKASVLCPGWVNTKIMDAERNRPGELVNKPGAQAASAEREAIMERGRQVVREGMSPERVAAYVFAGIRNEQLYILTHFDWNADVQKRTDDILNHARELPDEGGAGA